MKTQMEEFISNLKKNKGKNNWIEDYFDFLNELLTDNLIKKHTAEIITTKDLKLIIGSRTVVMPYTKNQIYLIMPLGTRKVIEEKYKAFIHPDFFKDNSGNFEALWVAFDRDIIFEEDNFIFDQWEKAVKDEIGSKVNSRLMQGHVPDFFKAIMDIDYRKELLKDI